MNMMPLTSMCKKVQKKHAEIAMCETALSGLCGCARHAEGAEGVLHCAGGAVQDERERNLKHADRCDAECIATDAPKNKGTACF